MVFLNLQNVRWLGILFAFLWLASTHAALNAQSGPTQFYYYQGTRVPLNVNPNLVAVRFRASVSNDAQKKIIEATGDVENFETRVNSPIGGLLFMNLRAGRDPFAAAARLRSNGDVEFVSAVYDVASVQLAETNEFLVRFKENISETEIARVNQTHNVSLARALPNSKRVLVLKPNAGNVQNARELANVYFESGAVEFAEPNFVLRAPPPPPPSRSAQRNSHRRTAILICNGL